MLSDRRAAAKEEAREVLSEVARTRDLIAYVDLVKRISAVRYHQRSPELHELLGEISKEEHAAGRALLSAVVVTRDTKRPGAGFFQLAKELGRTVADEKTFWSDELERVYEAHLAGDRSPGTDWAISVRLDTDAVQALEMLMASGMTRSEAIRRALVDTAEAHRRESLAQEAKAVADDPADRAAIAEIATFMDALSAEG